jgi:hypothetical protein
VLCKINDQNAEVKVRLSNQSGNEVYNERISFKLKDQKNALEDLINKLIRNGAKEIIQR